MFDKKSLRQKKLKQKYTSYFCQAFFVELFLFPFFVKVGLSNTIFVIFVIRKVFRSFTKKLHEVVSTLSIGRTIGLIEF
jgi:hypothetical protein